MHMQKENTENRTFPEAVVKGKEFDKMPVKDT